MESRSGTGVYKRYRWVFLSRSLPNDSPSWLSRITVLFARESRYVMAGRQAAAVTAGPGPRGKSPSELRAAPAHGWPYFILIRAFPRAQYDL